jgi:hypothetical protein
MLVDNVVSVRVHTKNILLLRKNGHDVKINDIINIPILLLSKKSHVEVNVKCDICGNIKKIQYRYYNDSIEKYNYYTCSTKCAYDKNRKTKLEKYGDENYNNYEQIKKSLIEKYGVDCIFKCEKERIELKKKFIKKYGVSNPSQVLEFKEKKKKTNLEKYGNENFVESEYFYDNVVYYRGSKPQQDLTILYFKKKYNIYINEIYKKNNKILYNIKCDNNKNHNFDIHPDTLNRRLKCETILCTKCNSLYYNLKSGLEINICDFIKKYINIINNYRIENKEIDVYIPSLKIGIEINGLWWHNNINKLDDYHKNKKEFFKKHGIDLYFIYEDDWKYKNDISKSYLLNLLNIEKNIINEGDIIEINKKSTDTFLKENNLVENINSDINIGLINNDIVTLVICFKKLKLNDYEMIICNKNYTNHTIKIHNDMINYFLIKYIPNNIITYINLDFENVNNFKQMGFNIFNKLTYKYYISNNKLKSKLIFNKNDEKKIFLKNKKKYKIYNSGVIKATLKLNT